jgi:hypothetical protein
MASRIIWSIGRVAAILLLAISCATALASLMAMSRSYATTGFQLVRPGLNPWPTWGKVFEGFSHSVNLGPLFPWIGIHCVASLFLMSRAKDKGRSVFRSQILFVLLWIASPTTMRVFQHESGNLADAVIGTSGAAWGGLLFVTVLFIRKCASGRNGLPHEEPLIHRGGKVTGSLSDASRKSTAEAGDFA